MNAKKRLVGALLAAALALCAGCSSADTTWAYRTADQTPPVGVYILGMINSVGDAQDTLSSANGDDENYKLPKYKKMLGESVNGQTMDELIRSEAKHGVEEFIAIEQKFAELGLTLEPDAISYAASEAAQAYKDGGDFFIQNGIAESTLALMMENQLKRQQVFLSIYGEGGSQAVSAADLRAHYDSRVAKVDLMFFSKNPEAENDDAEERAKAYLKRLQDGEDFYALVYDQLTTGADDPSTVEKPQAGSRTMLLTDQYRIYYGDELVDAALALSPGEFGLAEDDTTFYLMEKIEVLDTDSEYTDSLEGALYDMKGEEFEATLETWAEAVSLEANEAALSRYTPARLKEVE